MSHGITYTQGRGQAQYEEWDGNQQLAMNFVGNFVQDGDTFNNIQIQFNKTYKRITVQANLHGTWVHWFTINGT